MGHEQRLTKLERLREEEAFYSSLPGRYIMARRACTDGTADLAQYQLINGPEVDATRRDLRAMAPAMVAREQLGQPRLHWQRLLAYPPERPLPDDLAGCVDALALSATLSQRDLSHALGPAPSILSSPELRQSAAIDLLAIGGHHGLGLRRDIWTDEDGQRVLTGRVLEAAEVRTIAIGMLASRFDWHLFNKDPKTLKITQGHDGETEITYASLAAHIGTWKPKPGSEKVRKGQQPGGQ